MKKILVASILLFGILLSGCSQTTEEMKSEKAALQTEVSALQKEVKALTSERDSITTEIKEASGEAVYILNLEVGIDRFALDFENMLKDAMNEFTFEIIVSKECYDELDIGDRLNEQTRMGSIILAGSYGKQYIEVIGKRVE